MDPFLQAVIGEYRITGLLGEGGMGRVYRGVHTRLIRTVAVKILTAASGDDVFIQRFMNEAQIQSQLRDPGVAALYDFTEYHGNPVIIMEYIDGETIQQISARRGAWSAELALPVLIACARTLAYVHAQGIVHRDLKSANVKVNSAGEVKLLDFGIATGSAVQRMTVAGFVIGTFQSLSPEQTRGEQATPESDIWAFGVLAYEMLTGSLPFEGSNAAELFSKIARAHFTAPNVLKPGLPAGLDRIIARCLKREPRDRYHSMTELADDLAHVTPTDGANPLKSSFAFHTLGSGAIGARRFWSPVTIAFIVLLVATVAGISLWRRTSPGGEPPPALDAAQSASAASLLTVTVDTVNGSAEVWQDGTKLGVTPYEFHRPYGSSVDAVLKRPGFQDTPIRFDVSEVASYEFNLDRSSTP
jgi:serine/threonine protein kinase